MNDPWLSVFLFKKSVLSQRRDDCIRKGNLRFLALEILVIDFLDCLLQLTVIYKGFFPLRN